MPNYFSPTPNWVREQVELYGSSGGTHGTTLLDKGLPYIIVTHLGFPLAGFRASTNTL